MPARRRVATKLILHHGKRGLGTIAASAAALLMALGLAASPAVAAPAAHPAASHTPLTVKIHSFSLSSLKISLSPGVQRRTEVVKLSAAQCAILRNTMRRAHGGAAAMKKCEIGVGITARSAGPQVADGWQDFYAQATACFGDQAIFGGPTNSASCTAEGYTGIEEEFAGNGSWMNLHWETPYYYASQKFSFTRDWLGVTGNNSTYMVVGDNWDYSSPIEGTGTMELRIYNQYCDRGAYMCFVAAAYWQGA